jgi:hypothetical protein
VLVEHLCDQRRHRYRAASSGRLGFGPVAADLGRGFEHVQSEMRDVYASYAQASDLGEAQAAGTCDVHHGLPAVRRCCRQPVEVLGAEREHVGLGYLGQLDASGGGAGEQFRVDGGVERGSQYPVDRSSGAGSDLAAQVGDEGLNVGLPQLRELNVAEPWDKVATDSGLITKERRWSLMKRVRCSPFLEPLCDRHIGVERRVHERAAHEIGLGERQPTAGLGLCWEGFGRWAAVRQPRLVAP